MFWKITDNRWVNGAGNVSFLGGIVALVIAFVNHHSILFVAAVVLLALGVGLMAVQHRDHAGGFLRRLFDHAPLIRRRTHRAVIAERNAALAQRDEAEARYRVQEYFRVTVALRLEANEQSEAAEPSYEALLDWTHRLFAAMEAFGEPPEAKMPFHIVGAGVGGDVPTDPAEIRLAWLRAQREIHDLRIRHNFL